MEIVTVMLTFIQEMVVKVVNHKDLVQKKVNRLQRKGLFDLEETTTTTTTIIMVVVVVIIKEMAVLSVGQGMVDGNAKKKVF